MNKKRVKTIAATAAAGCLLLTMSVTAFASTGSGYEDYKNAVESTILAQNGTINAQFEVMDNGLITLTGNSVIKMDGENCSSKTDLTIDGVSKTYETSKDEANGYFVSRVDDQYYVMQKDNNKTDKEENDALSASSSTVKLAEMLTDTLVGDVKNQFVKEGQTVSLDLEGEQIPQLAKIAISAAVESNGRLEREHHDNGLDEETLQMIKDKLPILSNIDVKSIKMMATIDGNVLKDNQDTIVITGVDASGTAHELSVMIKGDISHVGNTNIDNIDTTGKDVKTINWKEHHEE